jgi:hypothetical protein
VAPARWYQLEQQYGFEFTGNYWINWKGLGEKWVQAAKDGNAWYYILPNGELHRWASDSTATQFITTLETVVYDNPALLHRAHLPASELQTLDQQYGFYTTGNYWTNYSQLNEKWLQSTAEPRQWFVLLPDGSLYRWRGSQTNSDLIANVGSVVCDNPSLLHDPGRGFGDSAGLRNLNQQYGFYTTGNYWSNYSNLQEKWLRSTAEPQQWFVLLPDGSLYRWKGSRAASDLIANVGSVVWDNPSLLHEARANLDRSAASVSLNTTATPVTLTIDPTDGLLGDFWVTVLVNDGVASTSRTFKVTVKK